jgi:hypothetical protein
MVHGPKRGLEYDQVMESTRLAGYSASFRPSTVRVALATQLAYRRDESEKIFQRILFGDCRADYDRFRPPI